MIQNLIYNLQCYVKKTVKLNVWVVNPLCFAAKIALSQKFTEDLGKRATRRLTAMWSPDKRTVFIGKVLVLYMVYKYY